MLAYFVVAVDLLIGVRRLYESFLEEVDLFKNLEEYERHKVADSLEIIVFEDNQVAIKQG